MIKTLKNNKNFKNRGIHYHLIKNFNFYIFINNIKKMCKNYSRIIPNKKILNYKIFQY